MADCAHIGFALSLNAVIKKYFTWFELVSGNLFKPRVVLCSSGRGELVVCVCLCNSGCEVTLMIFLEATVKLTVKIYKYY